MDEVERRLSKGSKGIEHTQAEILGELNAAELRQSDAEREQERRDLIDPSKIKERAAMLPMAKIHEIMQWGWEAEKLFAARQDEAHDAFTQAGLKAQGRTGDVTARIKKMADPYQAGFLKRVWLRAVRHFYDDSISQDLKNACGDYFAILSPQERFQKIVGFVSDLERAVEHDITIAQDQIGRAETSSREMDEYYTALRTYGRELKRFRPEIVRHAQEQHAARFSTDEDADSLRALHDDAALDERTVDECLSYLDLAVNKCKGEYGFYVSAIKHERLAIEAMQGLLRERLPLLEKSVKDAIKLLEAQKATGARGRAKIADKALAQVNVSAEDIKAELARINQTITLQIEAIEAVHEAITHDELLVIEQQQEPTALLALQKPLMLPAPDQDAEDEKALAIPLPAMPKTPQR